MRYSPSCPTDHPPASYSTLGCAVGEAFADWYAVLVRENDVGRWKNDLETNYNYMLGNCQFYCSDDGAIIQGAIHAFLWDLTDGGTNEPHDRVQVTPRSVTDLIRSCQVKPGNGSEYVGYNGVDHLIYCIENRSPYSIRVNGVDMTFFLQRGSSSRPTASRSTGLVAIPDDVRRLWLVDLYARRPGVGSSPVFNSEEPPTDPLQPPVDSGCGTQLIC